MQVPILTYHACDVDGNEHQNNDLVALAEDLQLIHQSGYRVIPMSHLYEWHQGLRSDEAVEKAVVLTCDDGTWFDYYDLDHPFHGRQKSLFNVLKHYQQENDCTVHMSSFVIVSPAARKILDEKCLIGKGWWTDKWWLEAQQSGLISIENHSWDHNHGVLENTNVNDDTFECVNNLSACDQQIKQSQQYIKTYFNAQHEAQFFAYPYGNYSAYLKEEYLPTYGHQLGLRAALTTQAGHVTKESDIWALPRFVCRNDWRSTDQLSQILSGDM